MQKNNFKSFCFQEEGFQLEQQTQTSREEKHNKPEKRQSSLPWKASQLEADGKYANESKTRYGGLRSRYKTRTKCL